MSSRNLYLGVLFLAFTVTIVSFASGNINFKIKPSALHRHELFALFLYFLGVYNIYNLRVNEDSALESISYEKLKPIFGLEPIVILSALTILVLSVVLITS